MQVELQDIGRPFNQGWVFRHVSASFETNRHAVIKGANGTGKSTLLQIIFGSLTSSEGNVVFKLDSESFSHVDLVHRVTLCAPYLQLVEEFTLKESIDFQANVIPFRNGLKTDKICEIIGLAEHADKQLKSFSSGMKQRVKLACAILADVPLVLLDEPASNLDKNAISWYNDLVMKHKQDRLFIVCSNSDGIEFEFCKQELDITGFK